MAQADYFLKLDGIKGESKDSKHKGEIQIESFSLGAHNSGTAGVGGGHGAGKVVLQDLTCTHKMDIASPSLFLHCCNGKHIKEGTLVARKAGETQLEYLKIKMTDILISSVQDAGHAGSETHENFTMNFAKIEIEYHEQNEKGASAGKSNAGWDVQKNEKI